MMRRDQYLKQFLSLYTIMIDREKYNKEYYKINKEYYKKKIRESRNNNPEMKSNQNKRYYEKHKEEHKLRVRSNKATNTYRRSKNILEFDDKTINQQSLQYLLEYQKYKCKLCNCDLRKVIKHMDHVMPLSK
jgi:hypothetical protein